MNDLQSRSGRAQGTGIQLRIDLVGVEPPIWRRFVVPEGTDLEMLHRIIQSVMGWDDDHLYSFEKGKRRLWESPESAADSFGAATAQVFGIEAAGNEYPEGGAGGAGTPPKVSEILDREGSKLTYIYDFGDNWEHLIVSEGRAEETVNKPCVLDGARACPPEDCGGTYGYAHLLEAIVSKAHRDHRRALEWMGESFDPEAFDVEAANRKFDRARKGSEQ